MVEGFPSTESSEMVEPAAIVEDKAPEPMIYQSIRQSAAKYGLAGRYGVIESPEEDDVDHIVYFEFQLYNGKAAEDSNLYFMYA